MTVENHSPFTIHMGRCSIDLYSNDVGAPFEKIRSFAAYVGGTPTNISVGVRRLGLRSLLLTAVGEDPVGDFILHFLREEGVETSWIPRKVGRRSGAVLLGIEPPDRFPLVFYRDNAADSARTSDDVLAAPIRQCRLFQFAGTNLSREPVRSATLFAAALARQSGAEVLLDLDFRPDQWHDPRAFGVAICSALRLVDIAIGTEDEINAAVLADTGQINLTHSQLSDARVGGDVQAAVQTLLALGPKALIQKRGAEGVWIHLAEPDGQTSRLDVPGFPVEVYNILGAGDAFAAGFIYGHVNDWGWQRAGRLGNACGAWIVTKHGCANFMPTYDEIMAFVEKRGGW
ncbi:MAG: 5-dehydro-2-deoxygluconokinase [Ardenticatenaceae bacterium]